MKGSNKNKAKVNKIRTKAKRVLRLPLHTIIAYCQQNRSIRFAIYTDLFNLIHEICFLLLHIDLQNFS